MPQTKEKISEQPKEPIKVDLTVRPDLVSVFADLANVAKKSDGMYMLLFAQNHPLLKTNIEQARILLTETHMVKLIDAMCKQSGHYPSDPNKKDK